MNMYGLIVNEIGMREAITELQQEILFPVARLLFPLQSTQFDAHHSFIVRYANLMRIRGLDMHTDDSDVTSLTTCVEINQQARDTGRWPRAVINRRRRYRAGVASMAWRSTRRCSRKLISTRF